MVVLYPLVALERFSSRLGISNWRVIVRNVVGSPRAPNVDQLPLAAPFISGIRPVIIEDTSLPILQSVYRFLEAIVSSGSD
jgi:hypothetical protein